MGLGLKDREQARQKGRWGSHPRSLFAPLINLARAFQPHDAVKKTSCHGEMSALHRGLDSALSSSGVQTSHFSHTVELLGAARQTAFRCFRVLGRYGR